MCTICGSEGTDNLPKFLFAGEAKRGAGVVVAGLDAILDCALLAILKGRAVWYGVSCGVS